MQFYKTIFKQREKHLIGIRKGSREFSEKLVFKRSLSYHIHDFDPKHLKRVPLCGKFVTNWLYALTGSHAKWKCIDANSRCNSRRCSNLLRNVC